MGVLTGIPLLAGQLAGPAFSELSERGVLSAQLVGVMLAGGILALAWTNSGRPAWQPGAAAVRRPVIWAVLVAPLVLIQAFTIAWTIPALRVVGLPGAWGWGIVILLPWLAALLSAGGRHSVLPVTALVALVLWVVFLAGFPWFHTIGVSLSGGLQGSLSIHGPGPKAVPYPPHVLRAVYSQRWWDDVALAAAGTFLMAPWLWLVHPADAHSHGFQARNTGWRVVALVGAAWVFMALGTQQVAGLNPLVGGLLVALPVWLQWVGLVAWVAGLTAAFGTAWAGTAERLVGPVRRMVGLALPSAVAGLVAGVVLVPLTYLPGWPRAAVAPLFINAEAGLLMVAYLVAPALGALAVAALGGRHGRVRPAGWTVAAWAAGLAASLPGLRGLDRWAGGAFWHHLFTGVPAGYGLGFFWLSPVPGLPDWGLAAGVGVSLVVSALGLRWSRPRSLDPTRTPTTQ